jgi:hypothetical protein
MRSVDGIRPQLFAPAMFNALGCGKADNITGCGGYCHWLSSTVSVLEVRGSLVGMVLREARASRCAVTQCTHSVALGEKKRTFTFNCALVFASTRFDSGRPVHFLRHLVLPFVYNTYQHPRRSRERRAPTSAEDSASVYACYVPCVSFNSPFKGYLCTSHSHVA